MSELMLNKYEAYEYAKDIIQYAAAQCRGKGDSWRMRIMGVDDSEGGAHPDQLVYDDERMEVYTVGAGGGGRDAPHRHFYAWVWSGETVAAQAVYDDQRSTLRVQNYESINWAAGITRPDQHPEGGATVPYTFEIRNAHNDDAVAYYSDATRHTYPVHYDVTVPVGIDISKAAMIARHDASAPVRQRDDRTYARMPWTEEDQNAAWRATQEGVIRTGKHGMHIPFYDDELHVYFDLHGRGGKHLCVHHLRLVKDGQTALEIRPMRLNHGWLISEVTCHTPAPDEHGWERTSGRAVEVALEALALRCTPEAIRDEVADGVYSWWVGALEAFEAREGAEACTAALRGADNIVAYAYDADTHCPSCAMSRFGAEPLGDTGTFVVPQSARDSEGNPVHPVFDTDEFAADAAARCGTHSCK